MTGIDRVSTVTIAVNDENEACRWFIEKLGFEKRLDLSGPGLRWLTVAPKNQKEVQFLLATWFPEHIGKNATCVVDTLDCRKTYEELKRNGVTFSQEPRERPYGVEAVFQDLCGNTYALVEHQNKP
ncbi:MAG TPA: VOC family protein [Blastocatellia bacterium]|nr:VOC family protein [Blastocatellia bacterium]